MAKTAEYLKQILSARYGRDVRQSIHDAISAINDESTECWATVEKVPETLAIAAVKDTVSGKDITLEMSSDFVLTDFKAWGNTEQDTTTGKNLLDCSGLTTTTTNGVTFTPVYADNGELEYINVNGTATIATTYDIGSITYTANQEYALNGCPSGGSSAYKIKATTDSKYADSGSGVTFTCTKDTEAIVSIVVYSGATVSNLKFYPMIRLASITDGTYEPHTAGKSPNPQFEQPIRSVVLSEIRTCGKNLWNYGDLWSRSFIYLCPINKGESVTLSYDFVNDDSGYDVRYGLYVMDSVNNWTIDNIVDHYADNKVISSVNGRNVITVTNNTYSVGYLYFRQIVPTGYARLSNIQVEVGSTATPYEPYTESVVTLSEPITLNGLDDVQDYIDAKRGVEHYKFAYERVLGSNIIGVTTDEAYAMYGYAIVTNIEGKSKGLSLSNRFIGISYDERTNNVDTFRCYLDLNKRLIFRTAVSENANFADLATVQSYFDNNEVYALYELADPIETPLPDADVEALKNIRTFKGITHVFTDSTVKPDMEVEYVIDTKMYIDKKIAELA